MTIAETIEAIERLGLAEEFEANCAEEVEGEWIVPVFKTADLKALAESYTRLLEGAKLALDYGGGRKGHVGHRIEDCSVCYLAQVIAEAEKS
jgi:hypothetical protein